MQVALWADVVCSWCGIAVRRVAAAIAAFERVDDVASVHRSFRLMANEPEGVAIPSAVLERAWRDRVGA